MISAIDTEPAGADLVTEVETFFSPAGVLSRAKNFEFRPEQQAMAVAVARSLQDGGNLLVEAGTGVGKSLAYLVPSILFAVRRRKKAVISTHTINLQEQLVEKDLPMLQGVLPVDFRFTMLKGRQNYLCTRRLKKAIQQADGLFTSPEQQELQRIREWSQTTADGTLSDFDREPDPKIWAQVCSERGLCSPKLCGSQSEFGKEQGVCFFQKARQRILAADVLVLNHTLFFMHLAGVEEGAKGGVLFKNDFVVFDEAHTVEQVAARHIGLSLSSGQIRWSLQRLWNPRTEKGLLGLLRKGSAAKEVTELLTAADQFFAMVESACDEIAQSRPASRFQGGGQAARRPQNWRELRIRRPDLVEDNLTLHIHRLREQVAELVQICDDRDTADELLECNRRLGELRDGIALFLSQEEEDHVYWVERSGRALQTITLNAAPVEVAAFLRHHLFGSDTSVIMTSATLATTRQVESPANVQREKADGTEGRSRPSGSPPPLAYFASRVGGERAVQHQLDSPFDYPGQMRLHIVNKMPDPREASYTAQLAHWIRHFLKQTQGKAFVLFTSFHLMHEVAGRIERFLEDEGIALFTQGTGMPRSVMLEKFRNDIDSVLFGTDSFWQGVDVPGESLSNVIITRLPFAVPDHPLIEARVERIEAQGGNSFMEFSLPEAILKFRQGVGRLIRTQNDRGIVVILDNRVLTKRYGQAFLNAIPKCPSEII